MKIIECENCIHFGTDYDLEEYAGATVRREYAVCNSKKGDETYLGESWYEDEKGCQEYEN